MSNLKDSTIFKIMAFAADKHMKEETFTGKQLCEHLKKSWAIEVRKYATMTWRGDIIREGIFEHSGDTLSAFDVDEWNEQKFGYQITYQAMTDYMEWVELQEARTSSKKAMWFAIVSIFIAALAFGTNVYFAL